MKYIRICGDCGATLHLKKMMLNETFGYRNWFHLTNGEYHTCPNMPPILKLGKDKQLKEEK